MLVFVATSVLVVGGIAFLVAASRDDARAPLPPGPVVGGRQRAPAKVDPAARVVAGKFILTAVAQRNTGDSWPLVHPDLRAGFTRREWAKGNIPVVPFPVSSIGEARFRVTDNRRGALTLEVALIPKARTTMKAEVFSLGLTRIGSGAARHWVVEYWMPRPGPVIRALPS